ncbi:Roadblock/LC7 domain-containing protein, partial [Lichtheimia hyalospora FSU 10163]
MLKPKVISQVLQQTTHHGVKASLLMNNEGSLLAFAADQARTTKTYAAIAASIWATYKQEYVGGDVGTKGGLQFLIMDCEDGIVYVTSISSMLLCMVSDHTVELGILRAKAEAISNHLQGPL